MNGLSFIRTKCNYSLSELANELGVTRQMVSAWENGRKEIPDSRKKELSAFFGIEERFLGEISDSDIEKLMKTAMYSFSDGKTQRLHYGTDGSGNPVKIDDTMESLDERLQRVKKEESILLAEIKDKLHAGKADSIMDVVKQTEKGCELLGYMSNILDIITTGTVHERMMRSYEIRDVMDAMMITYGKATRDEVEERIYTGESMMRISCFGFEDLEKAVSENHRKYIREYERMQKHTTYYNNILTYGIPDISGIRKALKDQYNVYAVDDCFTDILAYNASAVVLSENALSESEYDELNETFELDSDTIVIFTGEPKRRLIFKYYTMSLMEMADAAAVKAAFSKIKAKHETYAKGAII